MVIKVWKLDVSATEAAQVKILQVEELVKKI